MQNFSNFIIPAVFLLVILAGLWKRIDVFAAFLEGVREGMESSVRLFPALLVLVAAIGIFRASGAPLLLSAALAPLAAWIGLPAELIPLALIRPLSGSGAVVFFQEILHQSSPDSFLGRAASVMMGSTDTTFYTIALYYSAANITKTRHTLACSLAADLTGFWVSVLAVRLLFA